jgi:SAM-dependent methyltransferase
VSNDPNAIYYEANRARWDESVPIHAASAGYDLEGFLRGEKTLYPVEMDEVGDVRGKSLLHLQCHFGMDTLNWARLGAKVTGLDFSGAAVERARQLAAEIGIEDATFVQANVYDAPQALNEQFDIIYTGIGALCWLPDIRRWAQVVASLLKPGGFVYLYEGHPVLWALDNERGDDQLVLREPYFETEKPTEFIGEYTYVDGPPLKNTLDYEWNHGLGEIVTALIEAGLRLEFLHEHREVAWKALPALVSIESATTEPKAPNAAARYARRDAWQLPPTQRDLCPLMYSLKATRPA